jgi:hypothetical protein
MLYHQFNLISLYCILCPVDRPLRLEKSRFEHTVKPSEHIAHTVKPSEHSTMAIQYILLYSIPITGITFVIQDFQVQCTVRP